MERIKFKLGYEGFFMVPGVNNDGGIALLLAGKEYGNVVGLF